MMEWKDSKGTFDEDPGLFWFRTVHEYAAGPETRFFLVFWSCVTYRDQWFQGQEVLPTDLGSWVWKGLVNFDLSRPFTYHRITTPDAPEF
jgi:hypothetical protein